MTKKKGCPAERGDGDTIYHSGADKGPYIYLTDGYRVLITFYSDITGDSRPDLEVVRCQSCGRLWEFTYAWPDRPPQILDARVIPVEGREEYFNALNKRLKKELGKTVAPWVAPKPVTYPRD